MTTARRPILVIEDDTDIRALLRSRLERLGYEVRTAGTGEEGLAAAIADPPRLIMLDILLPGIDGWEVARRLRADPVTATVPVVIASIVEPQTESDRLHTSGYLVKPFTARQVESIIHKVVSQTPAPAAAHPQKEI
jgi:DNA-binding response OmpR family regulator